MSKKNILIFVATFLLGLVATWLIITKSSKSTIRKELRDFAVADTASITKIFLADKKNNSVLLEKINGIWMVNSKYYARMDIMNTLLTTVKSLEVLNPVGKKAQPNIIKTLAAHSIKVEIYQNDKLTKLYYVGGETADQEGTYMLLADPETGENSTMPFAMFIPGFNGYLTTRYLTIEDDWRDRAVFKYLPNNIRSVKVQFAEDAEQSFEVKNDGNNSFSVVELQTQKPVANFDTIAVKQYLSYFQNIHYEALANNFAKKDSVLAAPHYAIISVTDNKNSVNKIKLFKMTAEKGRVNVYGEPLKYDPDRLYALLNDGKEFAVIQYFVFGKLMPEINYFKKK